DYQITGGWPSATFGQGNSLEIIDPNGDPDDPANWRASSVQNGTPGLANSSSGAASVILNEVMAKNVSSFDANGGYPDWVELFNAGANSVDLTGWSLSNDGNIRKYTFTNGPVLPSGGYLILECDTNNLQAAATIYHTGFALNENGDSVFLYDQAGNRADAISFGNQLADYSIGRVGNAWALTTPTPLAPNTAAATASQTNLVVNEWLANSIPGASDWLELYNNSSTSPVGLRNLYLKTSNDLFQVTSLSFLPPHGYIQLIADQNPGSDHVDFKLHGAGDTIALADASGAEFDRVTFGAQIQGISQGRFPDGASTISSFPGSASPGTTDYLAVYTGPVLNEIMARNASYTNPVGRVADWVEFFNPNLTSFDLSGMSLSFDSIVPGQWRFPVGSSIPAQSYLVLWCDIGAAPSTNASPNLNTGNSIKDNGAVYLFNTSSQLVDFVEFGFQVTDKSIGKSGGAWQLLDSPTPGATNSAPAVLGSPTNLRFNEWMAAPASGNDWFEVYNQDTLPVKLTGLYLTDDPAQVFATNYSVPALSYIAGKGFAQWQADGQVSNGRDHVPFSMDAQGELLRLYNTNLSVIDEIFYDVQLTGVSQGRLPDGTANIVSFPFSSSPGKGNYLPLPNAFVNEVLTHATPPLEKAIELANTGLVPMSVGGWYLSDSADNLKKYRLTNGTAIPGGGYLVIYENQFGPASAGVPFSLDAALGGQVWFSQADGFGNLTGYRAVANFGAAASGVSFGRFTTSIGVDYPALSQHSFGNDNPATVQDFRSGTGAPNSYPLVGPIIINEIMYHPPDIGGTNDDTVDEFVELLNVTGSAVPLYDATFPSNCWRLQDGIDFTFPLNTSIAAGSYVLVVNFDPVNNPGQATAFRNRYGVSGAIPLFGPYGGKLDNGGEAISLIRPDSPLGNGLVPNITVDRIEYGTTTPWPSGADGTGLSLQRRVAGNYGNEPLNWLAGNPTAGSNNGAPSIPLPSITQQPQSAGGLAGTNITLTVSATGGLPLSYQWRLNGVNIPNETNTSYSIPNLQPANEGIYNVFVSNPAGAVLSSSAQVAVQSQPVILQQPQTQAGIIGGSATFSVAASGGNLSYQWRFYGTNLAGATNSAVTLTNLQASSAGPYSVLISNQSGAPPVLSSDAYLVLAAPVITVQPQSQTNNAGSTILLSVSATGDPPISYQWRFNTVAINGATNSTYTITNAQFSNSGNYDVQVSNAASNVLSATASVRLFGLITQQPISRAVITNATTNFTVVASGTGTLRYQWRYNGSNITNNPSATNSVLNLTNVTLASGGTYDVMMTDDVGSFTSQPATLTVAYPPAFILKPPTGQTNFVGDNVTFTVRVSGSTPINFIWRKGATPITNIVLNDTNCSFTLLNIRTNDVGSYGCVVSNIANLILNNSGVFSGNELLTVWMPPVFATQPSSQAVPPGSNVTFTALAGGVPAPSYQWQFFSTNLIGATNSSFTVTNAQVANQGPYTIVALSASGSVTSQVATLSVSLPPNITSQPQSQTVAIGSNATFSVTATGTAPLQYQWRFNGTNMPAATNSTLLLVNVQTANEGVYTVFISNPVTFTNSQPAILTLAPILSGPQFIPNSGFQFILQGSTSHDYAVEFSADLTNWSNLTNLHYNSGFPPVLDKNATNAFQRYYRAKSSP
ncbi:MAG TPA: lamin tail domain-containing protein, partial [Verrucomicrobiae bacterium]